MFFLSLNNAGGYMGHGRLLNMDFGPTKSPARARAVSFFYLRLPAFIIPKQTERAARICCWP
jgi:hypothetical protein